MLESQENIDKFNAQTAEEHFTVNGIPVFAEVMSKAPVDRRRLLDRDDDEVHVYYYWVYLRDQPNDLTTRVRALQPNMPDRYNNLVGYHSRINKWALYYVS
jgi:hypothetical protein